MERFFQVTEKSPLYSEYMDYKKNAHDINETVKEFLTDNEVETTEYSAWGDSLYIVPTDKDCKKFEKMLCTPVNAGLRRFKVNSKMGKAWIKKTKDRDLKILHKPLVQFYFQIRSGGSYRLFDVDDIVYCSYSADIVDVPDGMIEIKGSEFFKVIEDLESK